MGFSLRPHGAGTPGGQKQAHSPEAPAHYPMMSLRGLSAIPNPARNSGEDIDQTPRQFRRWVDASGVQQIQIRNGLWNGVGRGNRLMNGIPVGWYSWQNTRLIPRIPGQTRGDVSGFHKRGPSPYNVDNMVQATAGSQPVNPGGPGTVIGGRIFVNPGSG